MPRTTAISSSPAFDSVKGQFDQWRNERSTRNESIPEHLWQAAAQLCDTCSISQVARSLKLSYTELKKRVVPPKSDRRPQFVPLDMSVFSNQWHLDCQRCDGARLRLSGGGQPPDVENMLSRFLA